MAEKYTLLRALIDGVLYDLIPRGSIYNVYVDASTTLAAKLHEIVQSLNGKVTPEQLAQAVKDALKDYVENNPSEFSGLPPITAESEGKYLQVKDGAAVWADLEIPQQYGLVTYDQTKTITIT